MACVRSEDELEVVHLLRPTKKTKGFVICQRLCKVNATLQILRKRLKTNWYQLESEFASR